MSAVNRTMAIAGAVSLASLSTAMADDFSAMPDDLFAGEDLLELGEAPMSAAELGEARGGWEIGGFVFNITVVVTPPSIGPVLPEGGVFGDSGGPLPEGGPFGGNGVFGDQGGASGDQGAAAPSMPEVVQTADVTGASTPTVTQSPPALPQTPSAPAVDTPPAPDPAVLAPAVPDVATPPDTGGALPVLTSNVTPPVTVETPTAPTVTVETPTAPVVVEAPAAPTVTVETPTTPVVVETPSAPTVVNTPSTPAPTTVETPPTTVASNDTQPPAPANNTPDPASQAPGLSSGLSLAIQPDSSAATEAADQMSFTMTDLASNPEVVQRVGPQGILTIFNNSRDNVVLTQELTMNVDVSNYDFVVGLARASSFTSHMVNQQVFLNGLRGF